MNGEISHIRGINPHKKGGGGRSLLQALWRLKCEGLFHIFNIVMFYLVIQGFTINV